MENKQGIVIQGPTNHYIKMVECYKHLKNVIWSTWEDEPEENIEYIRQSGIPLILNKKPLFAGHLNVNLQAISTSSGLRCFAGAINKALKVRGDVVITNVDKLLHILDQKNVNMGFLQMCKPGARNYYYELDHQHFSHDYPADVIMYGDIPTLQAGFNFQINEMLPIPPESLIAYNILGYLGIEFKLEYKHLINNGITFFLQDCLDNDINILWLKNGLSISDGTKNRDEYEY